MKKVKYLAALLATSSLFWLAPDAEATAAAEVLIVMRTVAPAARLLHDTVDLAASTVVGIACLPLGIFEITFGVLPGISFVKGLKHLGRGLITPFRFVHGVLTLPLDTLDSVADVLEVVY